MEFKIDKKILNNNQNKKFRWIANQKRNTNYKYCYKINNRLIKNIIQKYLSQKDKV